MVDTCVQCGSIVPEGTMVCKSCVDKAGLKSEDTDIQSIRVEHLFSLSLRCIYRQLKKKWQGKRLSFVVTQRYRNDRE